jgi:uncharacterized alpha-E superfamily protein
MDLLVDELRRALVDEHAGLTDSLDRMLSLARGVREFLSTATWRVLESIRTERDALATSTARAALPEMTEALDRIGLPLMALAGLAMESTVRGPGWRFLDLGRRLERAFLLLALLEATVVGPLPPAAAEPVYETVLASCESLVAYRRRYRSDLALDALCDLLVADDTNPRALAFQLDRLADDLAVLPNRASRGPMSGHEAELAAAQARLLDHEWRVTLPVTPGTRAHGLAHLLQGVRSALAQLDRDLLVTWFAHVSQHGQGPS